MLVPFVVDVDSLAPDPGWTPAQLQTCHQSLLDVWQRIGILKHDTDSFETSRLKQAVQQLPQKIRPQWLAMLQRNLLLACGNGWDGNVTPNSINQLDGIAQVALVDDTRAEVDFGLSEEVLSSPAQGIPNVEVCRILAVAHAKTFRDALAKSTAHIEPKETFRDIWTQRFKSLACAPIKRVVIVDRFVIRQLFNPPHQQLSGLDRFLRLLDADASGPRHVTLYSSWADLRREIGMAEIGAELNQVINRLQYRNIKQLKVVMLPNMIFGDVAHDRFIRFEGLVWDIGLGLKVFEGAFAAERSSATFKAEKVAVDGYKKVEEELAGHPQAKSRVLPSPLG